MMLVFCILLAFQLCSPTAQTEDGIVNGNISKPHSRPYMASLQCEGAHICGGLLIQKDFVVTAAHCKCRGYSSQPMTVVLGADNLTVKEESQQIIQVATSYAHPKFDGGFHYDIMLLKLEKKAQLNKNVKTIALPQKNKAIPAHVSCVVAGWGKTGSNAPVSDVLREATEWIQFNFECANIWKMSFNSKYMICTKFDKKKGGVCQGDSGGPLICKDKLEGLTAYTDASNCNNPKAPHVFTKIRFFLPWIKQILKGGKNAE